MSGEDRIRSMLRNLHELWAAPTPDDARVGLGPHQRWADLRATTAGILAQLPAEGNAPWLLVLDSAFDTAAALAACWQRGVVPIVAGADPAPRLFDRAAGVIADRDPGRRPLIRPARAKPGFAARNIDPTKTALATAFAGDGDQAPRRWSFTQLQAALDKLHACWGATVAGAPFLAASPIQDLSGLTLRLLWPLCAGSPFTANHDPDWARLLGGHREAPAVVIAAPADYASLAPIASELGVDWTHKLLFSCGPPLPDETAQAIRQACGKAPVEARISLDTGELSLRPYPGSAVSPLWQKKERLENGFRLEGRVPENLLFLEGHFPQAPVVPGVCQLKWVQDAIREHADREARFQGMEAVKFHRLLLPGQSFQMEATRDSKSGKWHYHLVCEDRKVASGRLLPA